MNIPGLAVLACLVSVGMGMGGCKHTANSQFNLHTYTTEQWCDQDVMVYSLPDTQGDQHDLALAIGGYFDSKGYTVRRDVAEMASRIGNNSGLLTVFEWDEVPARDGQPRLLVIKSIFVEAGPTDTGAESYLNADLDAEIRGIRQDLDNLIYKFYPEGNRLSEE